MNKFHHRAQQTNYIRHERFKAPSENVKIRIQLSSLDKDISHDSLNFIKIPMFFKVQSGL